MKKKMKGKGVVKGAPSGFVLSILVHAAAFALAGILVVFNVVQKEEKKFVPPKPVDRPKMKLKKPQVKVKKNAKPKSSERIVTKVQKANMPEIYLPEMSGIGDGVGTGSGYVGFDIMPDLSEVTAFGSDLSTGSDFVGTFYDFKRSRSGSKSMIGAPEEFQDHVAKFIRNDWDPRTLNKFYRSPKKLYASCFMVPSMKSFVAPKSFGEPDTVGWAWLAHYEGKLVHNESIRFRFWGAADDILMVRVNGELVLNACWPGTESIYSSWQSSDSKNRVYRLGSKTSVVGDWITLEAGVPQDMEVILGEVPGGGFYAMLLVEVEGVEYEHNYQNAPLLPIFRTDVLGYSMLDAIYEWLTPGEACLTNGPVFNDMYSQTESTTKKAEPEPEPITVVEQETSPLRIWTHSSGKTIEAEFITLMGDKVVVRDVRGKTIKIPLKALSSEDRTYIEMENPPHLKTDFVKLINNYMSRYKLSPKESDWKSLPPQVNDYTFGVKIKQTSSIPYKHDLTVEYFAFGAQRLDDRKYKLMDRGSCTFNMQETDDLSFSFKGNPIESINYQYGVQMRGLKYYGYVYTVKDVQGKVIHYAASNEWLYENLEAIKKLPVGAFLNRDGERVHPTGPKRSY